MNAVSPLRRVVVIGGGMVASMAALAFARALPQLEVILIPAPLAASLEEIVLAVWPSATPIFHRLGVDESMLLARGVAVPMLAREFRDWGTERWLCPEGDAAAVPGTGALLHRWLRAGKKAGAFHDLFPAAALAGADRFAPELLSQAGLEGADMALALSPERWRALLAEGCRQTRVRVLGAPIARVERRADGGWASVSLADGARVEADLFVWAAGRRPDEAWEDWSATLPGDRVEVSPPAGTPALLDRYRATDTGWEADWSMPEGTARVRAWSGDTAPAGADPARTITLRPGRAPRAWTGNVLRVGAAAAEFGALGRPGFTFAAHQMLLLLELLPGRAIDPLLSAEYDRRLALRSARLHDFLAAHLVTGARRRGAFWRIRREVPAPSSLDTTLAQFRRRGGLPHFDEESVTPDAWRAVLLGQGIRPETADPMTLASDPGELVAALDSARRRLRDIAGSASTSGTVRVPFRSR